METLIHTIDFSPLFLSLKTGILATVLTFFLGTAAARGASAYGGWFSSPVPVQPAAATWCFFMGAL